MDSSTPIANLPDPTNVFGGGNNGVMGMQPNQPPIQINLQDSLVPSYGGNNTSYLPMNPHPNPYGNQPSQNVMMNPPQYTQQHHKLNGNSFMFQNELVPTGNQPTHSLPSRDIHVDMSTYTHDEQVQPNYIPKPSKPQQYGYIPEEDTDPEIELENARRRRNREKRVRFVDDVFVEIQKPVIFALLFLFMQLPFVNTLMYKYLTFLKIYNDDGLMNIWGYILKSIVFGFSVYGIETIA